MQFEHSKFMDGILPCSVDIYVMVQHLRLGYVEQSAVCCQVLFCYQVEIVYK